MDFYDFRALNINLHCLEAMRYQALHLLCREGNYPEVEYTKVYTSFLHVH